MTYSGPYKNKDSFCSVCGSQMEVIISPALQRGWEAFAVLVVRNLGLQEGKQGGGAQVLYAGTVKP